MGVRAKACRSAEALVGAVAVACRNVDESFSQEMAINAVS